MKRQEFDIAVIGGGPAGTSAAISAARFGARVGLFEAGEFPRHKVCGEFASAESLEVLRDLLRVQSIAAPALCDAPVIDHVRLLLGGRVVTARVVPPALSISRYDLDYLLWQAAHQAGVDAQTTCEVRMIQGDGPFLLETPAGTVRAASVVIAAGRWSRFAPRAPIPDGPKWLGLKAYFREDRPPRSTDLYFFDHGYCGVQPVDDTTINACAMVRSDRAKTLKEVFALHTTLAERSRNWQAIMEPLTTAPLVYRVPQPVRDNMMFVGDAAAFIDPFVGDGISIALRSGKLSASCLRSFFDRGGSLDSVLKVYEREYAQQFAPLVTAASRIRGVLSWPTLAQRLAFELLRLPGVMPYAIRRTRHAS